MNQDIQTVLHAGDIMRIFGISQPTLYRWIAEARAGKNEFPLPIGNGYKRKLFWSRDAIIGYQNASITPSPKIESATQRKKRNTAAIDRLRQKGVSVKQESQS
jgi:predicted DNA-binding transcriptional regulator AlpA